MFGKKPCFHLNVASLLQSLLDDYGLADVKAAADAVKQAVQQEQFQKATELWSVAETVVEQVRAHGCIMHHITFNNAGANRTKSFSWQRKTWPS